MCEWLQKEGIVAVPLFHLLNLYTYKNHSYLIRKSYVIPPSLNISILTLSHFTEYSLLSLEVG